jgi:hypothetical protein
MKKKVLFTLILVMWFNTLLSQIVPPPIPPPPPPGLPINGGLIFLLISGLLYGIKKLK